MASAARVAFAIGAACAIAIPSSARADEETYPTPLQQQTQRSYVPQSVAFSGPPVLSADYDDAAPPDGYHRETRIRKGLVIGGSITFGTMYLFTVIAASAATDARTANAGSLYVPVAGPLLFMDNTSSALGKTFLGINALAQAAGAAMLIYGLASPKNVWVRNDLGPRLIPTPMQLGQSGTGFGVVGTF